MHLPILSGAYFGAICLIWHAGAFDGAFASVLHCLLASKWCRVQPFASDPIEERATSNDYSALKLLSRLKHARVLPAVFLLLASGQAFAETIVGVSFGPQAGPTNWTRETNATSGAATDLITESGASSDINMSYSITGTAHGVNLTLSTTSVPIHTPSLAALGGNIDAASGGDFSATFSNLVPGAATTYG